MIDVKYKIRVLMLTPIYPGMGESKAYTPVVHYFVREWVKQDADVRVMNYPTSFPPFFRLLLRPFIKKLGSRVGYDVRSNNLQEGCYEIDDVKVYRIPLNKIRPHSRYSRRTIKKALDKTIRYCNCDHFVPDVIVSHWANPSLEIMHYLKQHFGAPSCYVAHDQGVELLNIYKKESSLLLKEVDLLGYRSEYIRQCYERLFDCKEIAHFSCYSGIPSRYIDNNQRTIGSANSILFVGNLIQRKFPVTLVQSAALAFGEEDFIISYIGTGSEECRIREEAIALGVIDNIHLLGRLSRDEVVKQMDNHTVFAMISRGEAFGLVYLEAMARGCITIASKKGGFDGIIIDGENGFLCEAGNAKELAMILRKIKAMPRECLQQISDNAIKTARGMTDEKVASDYLSRLSCLVYHIKKD